jgi:biopolymer transport protein ExbD
MAELNTGDGGGKKGSGKVRSKKQNSKVDLTAMVDLAFLLITFFMLTTTLSKPQVMDLTLPKKDDVDEPTTDMLVDERRTLTVILGANNEIQWFHGLLATPIAGPKQDSYGGDGVRKKILQLMQEVPQLTGDSNKGLIVIIKPTKKSTYRNLVDILDEMAISGVETSAIVNDITKEELALLKNSN